MAEYSEMAHKHLANAPGSVVNAIYPVNPPQMHMQAPSQHPGRFQELPRLQVPPFAPTQQSMPAWKMPQQFPRMSVSNLLSGSFRSRAIPQPQALTLTLPPPPPAPTPPTLRRLPSFADILARTHLLHLMGRSSEPTETCTPTTTEAPMEDDKQMQPEKIMTSMLQQQIPMQLMENSYTTLRPSLSGHELEHGHVN
ncbi:unnamed protein product [Peronospora destructor]|uniref:Uncharacterized protein n=1 Tax=Peronospora destructor TaxID=86335 RepID=A0AAV0UTI5_9STRA|nr:unnamed protein product [Peronospora destructor]